MLGSKLPPLQLDYFTGGFSYAYGELTISWQRADRQNTGAGLVLTFGGFRLDIGRRELRRGAELIDLEPKAFDLLDFLIQNRHRVVSKDDLLQAIWDGRIVSDSAITTRINAVRRAIGDDGAAQRLVRTIARKGVRFVGEVSEQQDSAPRDRTVNSNIRPDVRPCIAVLRFRNLSGDLALDYLADGMFEETITALSRIRWLFVVAGDGSFASRDQVVDIKQSSHELGMRYALKGSVRNAGGLVRVTVQLIEAASGAHLWAERFDGSLGGVFDFQDKVAYRVTGAIEPILQATETAQSLDHGISDFSAYKAYLLANSLFRTSAKQIPHALAALEEAIARDPSCGLALTFAARCCMRLCLDGSSSHPRSDNRKGVDYARRALHVAGDDPGILANCAMVLAFFGEDIGAMIALVDRALMLNPSSARGWNVSSMLRNWSGQTDLAIEHAKTADHLSPRGGIGSPSFLIGISHLVSRRFDEALAALLLATHELSVDFPDPYRLLAACYTHLGRLDEAREVVQRLHGMTPLLIEGFSYLRNSEHRELLLSGLRSATSRTGGRSFHQLDAAVGVPMASGSSSAAIASLNGSDRDFAAASRGKARKAKSKSQSAPAERKSGYAGAVCGS